MNKLEEIQKKYNDKVVDVLYEEAQELLTLIDDQELYTIYSRYPEVFNKLSSLTRKEYAQYPELVEKAVKIFVEFIRNKYLTKEAYDAMTRDDIIDYLDKIIKKKTPELYNWIKMLE